jgi:hypothetical protein
MTRHIRLEALVLLAGAISACSLLETNSVKDITTDVVPPARVKFHNYSPNSVGVNFFANTTKMSAISTTACITPATAADTVLCNTTGKESTTGVVYGGTASGSLYMSIAPATYTLSAKMAAKDTIIASVSQAIDNGKYYSFFLSGNYSTTTKTSEAFVVEDPIPAGAIDYTKVYLRLVNAISDGTGPLNLTAKDTTTAIPIVTVNTGVAYKSAGTFVVLNEGVYNIAAPYTSGAASGIPSLTNQNLVGGRVYTVTARGITATASTLALTLLQNTR